MRLEPSIYKKITISEMTSEVMEVPEDIAGILAAAQWVRDTGYAEVTDVGADGFRFRSKTGGGWIWANVGDYMTLNYGTGQDPEFDMPSDGVYSWRYSPLDHVAGPPLHLTEDGEDEEG